ncbi:hypothetical protein Ddc_13911 [Ditylenchus destructor]|nr:hypothetical protein Ddc_13911 [Ditylenchus destructor]
MAREAKHPQLSPQAEGRKKAEEYVQSKVKNAANVVLKSGVSYVKKNMASNAGSDEPDENDKPEEKKDHQDAAGIEAKVIKWVFTYLENNPHASEFHVCQLLHEMQIFKLSSQTLQRYVKTGKENEVAKYVNPETAKQATGALTTGYKWLKNRKLSKEGDDRKPDEQQKYDKKTCEAELNESIVIQATWDFIDKNPRVTPYYVTRHFIETKTFKNLKPQVVAKYVRNGKKHF